MTPVVVVVGVFALGLAGLTESPPSSPTVPPPAVPVHVEKRPDIPWVVVVAALEGGSASRALSDAKRPSVRALVDAGGSLEVTERSDGVVVVAAGPPDADALVIAAVRACIAESKPERASMFAEGRTALVDVAGTGRLKPAPNVKPAPSAPAAPSSAPAAPSSAPAAPSSAAAAPSSSAAAPSSSAAASSSSAAASSSSTAAPSRAPAAAAQSARLPSKSPSPSKPSIPKGSVAQPLAPSPALYDVEGAALVTFVEDAVPHAHAHLELSRASAALVVELPEAERAAARVALAAAIEKPLSPHAVDVLRARAAGAVAARRSTVGVWARERAERWLAFGDVDADDADLGSHIRARLFPEILFR